MEWLIEDCSGKLADGLLDYQSIVLLFAYFDSFIVTIEEIRKE